jgi:hypothetical protein
VAGQRAHSAYRPAARDLQATADRTPVEHQDRVPEKGRSPGPKPSVIKALGTAMTPQFDVSQGAGSGPLS